MPEFPEEVPKAVAAFRVYARRVPLEGGDYTMDHSALVLLFGPDGRFRKLIRYRENPESALAKLRNLLAEASGAQAISDYYQRIEVITGGASPVYDGEEAAYRR